MAERVVNIRDLGRIGTWPADVRRIDRRSPYGNPFRIGQQPPAGFKVIDGPRSLRPISFADGWTPMDRAAVLAAYRAWLTGKLRAEPEFLEPLRGQRLACWCAPAPCHGDVIAERLEASGG